MRRIPLPLLACIAVLLPALLLLTAPLTAQQDGAVEEDGEGSAASSGGEVFFESLDVNVVNVDVYVTDKQGEPVFGLTRDDFELLEDGRPVEITNFYAERRQDRRRRAIARLPAGVPGADQLDPLEQVEVPQNQQLSVIIYFDNLHLRPFNRNRVGMELHRFLHERLQPGDQAMLVTFERSLHVRQPFTTDMQLISKAIDETAELSAFAVQKQTERRDVIRRIQEAGSQIEAESHAAAYARDTHNDARVAIKGLKEVVGSLGGLPGRKALVYVSDGIPMVAGEDLFTLIDLEYSEASFARMRAARYDVRREFQELVARANANRVTFYTLHAGGAQSHSSLSAEYGGTDRSFVEVDFVADATRQEPMLMMADATGGLAAINTNNIDGALSRVGDDFDAYYSLGYAPTHAGRGRYHDIEVKVKGRGLKVRHRGGYRDKTLETRISEGTLAALLYGATTNPLGVEVRMERPRQGEQGHYLVPLLVRIPLAQVTLLPNGDFHEGRLRVSVAVMDEDGDTSPPTQTPVPLRIPAAELETARGQYYAYSAELMMRPGIHRVAVGVRDDVAGETAFIREPVRVGG